MSPRTGVAAEVGSNTITSCIKQPETAPDKMPTAEKAAEKRARVVANAANAAALGSVASAAHRVKEVTGIEGGASRETTHAAKARRDAAARLACSAVANIGVASTSALEMEAQVLFPVLVNDAQDSVQRLQPQRGKEGMLEKQIFNRARVQGQKVHQRKQQEHQPLRHGRSRTLVTGDEGRAPSHPSQLPIRSSAPLPNRFSRTLNSNSPQPLPERFSVDGTSSKECDWGQSLELLEELWKNPNHPFELYRHLRVDENATRYQIRKVRRIMCF